MAFLIHWAFATLASSPAKHMPDVDVILIEVPDEVGGYGAKGVGEIGCVATAGAVAGALHSYDGIRRVSLPMDDAPAAAPLLPTQTQKLADRSRYSMNRRRLFAASLLLAAALGAYPLRVSQNMRDFEVWWTAAVRASAAQPLFRADDGHYQFKYLPAFAVLAMPLGVLPLPVAKPAWFFISVALIVALIAFSIRLLPEQRRPTWVLAVMVVLVMGKFYARELDLGQVNLVFTVAATAAFLAMKVRREMLAAALLVLTVAIKPYGVLLLPGLVVRRQRATAVAAAIGVGLLLLLPVPLYGVAGTIDLHWSWWQTVTATTPPNLLTPDNVSLASMYAKWLGMSALSVMLATASSLALLGAAAIVFLRRRSVSFPEGSKEACCSC